MNQAESATLDKARGLLTREEVERLSGLVHLRHHASATVRIAANMELMPILFDLKVKMSRIS